MASRSVGIYRVEWAGLEALREKLAELGDKFSRRVLQKAVNASAKPVLLQARRTTPVRPPDNSPKKNPPGSLRRAWIIKSRFYKNTDTAVAIVGPRKQAAPHAHLVEFGTKERFRKSMVVGDRNTYALAGEQRRWVQQGTRFVQVRVGSRLIQNRTYRTGRMPAFHVLRDAYEQKAANIKARLFWRLKVGIEEEAAKKT